MRGQKYFLRCGFLRGCTLRHFGLGQILAVDRDIGTTPGALKDGLAPLVLQRCCGPCMWRALLRHISFTSTDSSPVLASAAPRLLLGEQLPGASLPPTLRPAGCPRSWRTGGQDVPHLVRGRGRRRATLLAWCALRTRSTEGDATK